MTSIKPPSGRPPTPPPGEPSKAEGAAPAGAQFRELVGEAALAPDAAAAAAGSAAASPLEALAAAVKAGEVTAADAMDRLVERAAGQVAHHLSPAQREELLDVLRRAVATDPALAELRQILGE